MNRLLINALRHSKSQFHLWRIDQLINYLKDFETYSKFYDVQPSGSNYLATSLDSEMLLSLGGCTMMLTEQKLWNKYYCPIDLKGLTVLDAGAGDGETVDFFLSKGANKVVAVENDKFHSDLLLSNSVFNEWNTEIREKSFSIEDLQEIDFAKIDIEGSEMELMKLDKLPCKMVIEYHSASNRETLLKYFKELKEVYRSPREWGYLQYV